MENTVKRYGILLGIVVIFILLQIPTFTIEPPVFMDETILSNTAYVLTGFSDIGSKTFDKQFSIIDPIQYRMYGHVYFIILAYAFRLFPYTIVTIRVFSLFFGVLSLIMFYLLFKRITKNERLSLFVSAVYATDYFILKASHFGRVDIVVVFFILSSFIAYHTFPNSKLRIIGTNVGLILSFFTHTFLGIFSTVTIGLSILITQSSWKEKYFKVIKYLTFPTIGLIVWVIYLIFIGEKITASDTGRFYLSSIFSFLGMLPIRILFSDNTLYTWINFLAMCLVGIVGLWFGKTKYSRFFLIFFWIVFFMTMWRASYFYIFFISIAMLLLAGAIIYEHVSMRKVGYIFLSAYMMLNLVQSMTLIKNINGVTYSDYYKGISKCIPKKDANVLLWQITPDPFFQLVEERSDIRFGYMPVVNGEKIFMSLLPKADYVVMTYSYVYAIQEKKIWTEKNKILPEYRAELEKNFNISFLEYIKSNSNSGCPVYFQNNPNAPVAIVFVLHPTQK
ncbi:MAG: hypothetical protein WCO06_03070 [Candidatus Roizmanbacteria bacterium]